MGYSGILYGGGFYLLGIQALTVIAIVVWSTITCLICISVSSLLSTINLFRELDFFV